MSIAFIPNKNIVFENEKVYLEDKYQEGLKLVKVGILFYHFEKASPKKVVYGIELTEDTPIEYVSDDWDLVAVKKIRFEKMQKCYYVSQTPEVRFLRDNRLDLEYYQYYQSLFKRLANFILLPFIICMALLSISVKIPIFTIVLSFLLGLDSIDFSRKSVQCKKGACEASLDRGQLTGFEANYIITLKNLSEEQKNNMERKLSSLGYTRKVNNEIYRMQSPLNKEELFQEIISVTKIKVENLTLMSIFDLVLFPPY